MQGLSVGALDNILIYFCQWPYLLPVSLVSAPVIPWALIGGLVGAACGWAVARDAARRKLLRRGGRASLERALYASAGGMAFIHACPGPDGIIITASGGAAEEMFKYSGKEIAGQPLDILFSGGEPPPELLAAADGRMPPFSGEVSLQDRNGKLLTALASFLPVADERGNTASILAVIVDISYLKKTQRDLRGGQRREQEFRERLRNLTFLLTELAGIEECDLLLRRAVEAARERLGFERLSVWLATDRRGEVQGTWGVDENGKLRREAGRKLRVEPAEPMGRVLAGEEIVISPDVDLYDDEQRVVGRGDHAVVLLGDTAAPRGCLLADTLFTKRALESHDREVLGLLAVSLGALLRQREQAEELRRNEALYRALVEDAGDPIFVVDGRSGVIIEANRRASRMVGRPRRELVGMHEADIYPPDERGRIGSVLQSAADALPNEYIDLHVLHADGRRIPVQLQANTLNFGGRRAVVGIFRDMSGVAEAELRRKDRERRLQQSQKLESLGVLAGGIAHDFNNLLMGIMGNSELALAADLPPAASELVQGIRESALRAADLTRQMLTYSGQGAFSIVTVSLNRQCRQIAGLLRASISKKATLRFELSPANPAARADPLQLQQVIMNLVSNASEALEDKEGVITVSTGCRFFSAEFLSRTHEGSSLAADNYSFLQVEDNGPGMDPETRRCLFDPFFTTRFTGRGLGLAVVLGIVRAHGGAIMVQSEPGAGASFMILLPSADGVTVEVEQDGDNVAAAAQGERNSHDVQNEREEQGERQTVPARLLVVDDEAGVRQVLAKMLETAGHEVQLAADGQEAANRFRSDPQYFDMVLLDLTMPRMNGYEALREMRALRPGLRALLMSGYDEDRGDQAVEAQGFIRKPIRLQQLLEGVRQALGNPENPDHRDRHIPAASRPGVPPA